MSFDQAPNNVPEIVSTVTTENNNAVVAGKLSSISTQVLKQYEMREQENYYDGHRDETIFYIDWEPSEGTIDG